MQQRRAELVREVIAAHFAAGPDAALRNIMPSRRTLASRVSTATPKSAPSSRVSGTRIARGHESLRGQCPSAGTALDPPSVLKEQAMNTTRTPGVTAEAQPAASSLGWTTDDLRDQHDRTAVVTRHRPADWSLSSFGISSGAARQSSWDCLVGGRCDPPPICALCSRAPRVAACSLRQQLHPFSPLGNATAATTSPRRSLMIVAMPMVLPSWTTTFLLRNSVPVWLWRGWCEGLRIAVAANGGVTRDAAVGGQYLWETEGPTLECSSQVGGRGQPVKRGNVGEGVAACGAVRLGRAEP